MFCVNYNEWEDRELNNNPNFTEAILNECFKYADSFSMNSTYWSYCSDKDMNDMKKIEGELISVVKTQRWFGYCACGVPNPKAEMLFENVYRLNENTKKFLLSHYRKLGHDSEHKWGEPIPYEDLCFFRNGKVIFGTVTHEDICGAYPVDEENRLNLMKLMNWREESDDMHGSPVLPEYVTVSR